MTKSLPGRIEELIIALYERSFLEEEDVLLCQAWLKDLILIGYRFPEIVSSSLSSGTFTPVDMTMGEVVSGLEVSIYVTHS